MENTMLSLVKPDVLSENMLSISHYIKQSYSSARKQVQEGVNLIQEGVTFIKEEFTEYINLMALPVNNFLKDIAEIEADFRKELTAEVDIPPAPGVVPVSVAIATGPMEENY